MTGGARQTGASMQDSTTQLYIDDFRVGQTFAGASRTISQADVLGFSSLTGDAHPIHYDAEYAKRTRFGRPIVHGLHLISLTALGATTLSAALRDSMVAFIEQGAEFKRPVFIDDTVRSVFEVVAVERKPDRDWGTIKFRVTLANQDDATVLEAFHVYRLRARAEDSQ
jgi:3-hydroxybutyryl-CoA dehydratase